MSQPRPAAKRLRGYGLTPAPNFFYAKARAETAALLNYDIACLTPDQSLRLDCAVALRLALDDLQGRVVRGESVDVGRMLVASEALARLLPPAVLATPPSEEHGDPRVKMFEIYMEMRERGEIALKALPPEGGHQHRIDELEAENERLKARLAGGLAPALPDSPAIDPAEADITPPGEMGDCYAGNRPGPDDPPRRSSPVIEGRAVKRPNPPAASAAPQYDYNREQGWKDYVEADGTIRSTPRGRGHYWGPV
jgi:hypothetical protein